MQITFIVSPFVFGRIIRDSTFFIFWCAVFVSQNLFLLAVRDGERWLYGIELIRAGKRSFPILDRWIGNTHIWVHWRSLKGRVNIAISNWNRDLVSAISRLLLGIDRRAKFLTDSHVDSVCERERVKEKKRERERERVKEKKRKREKEWEREVKEKKRERERERER